MSFSLVPATPEKPRSPKGKHHGRVAQKPKPAPAQLAPRHDPRPSKFISGLSQIQTSTVKPEPVARSSSFAAAPPPSSTRDEDLRLIENIELGPKDHTPPFDDPNFGKLEPNSGINLISRKLPHEDLQDYIRGRYFVSPSFLYSIARLSPNKQSYDVPLEGDWLTIAIVAERGPIKLTAPPIASQAPLNRKRKRDSDDEGEDGSDPKKGRKYIHLKLVDFGCRSHSTTEGTTTIRGDACLTFLLFEADSISILKDADGKESKIYKGGSGGAFEACARLREGSVIAILNPKILKPFQRAMSTNGNADRPHPTNNLLAITPESDKSIIYIGHARDLGMCAALKKDGKACGSWCDKRVNDVCEFHVVQAIQRRRAQRPEFSVSTSSMARGDPTKAANKNFDPSRKWGLLPKDGTPIHAGDAGGPTYVYGGQVLNSRANAGPEYLDEKMGRKKQDKAKRRAEEATLVKLLAESSAAPNGAHHSAGLLLSSALASSNKKLLAKVQKEREAKERTKGGNLGKIGFSAEAIKRIGFDPTGRSRALEREKDLDKKLDIMASLRKNKNTVELGPRPGKRIRSGVFNPLDDVDAPLSSLTSTTLSNPSSDSIPLSNSTLKSGSPDADQTMVDPEDDELELADNQEENDMVKEVPMIDLDSD